MSHCGRQSTVGLFSPHFFLNWGTNVQAVWPWWAAQLEQSVAALLPFGGEWPCRVLHARQASPARPSPGARLIAPRVRCSPGGPMARRVGMAWVTVVLGSGRSMEGNGHQSCCYSRVWAPQHLPQCECLSWWCSVTPAQMSSVRRRWQQGPGLVPSLQAVLSRGVSLPRARQTGGRRWEHCHAGVLAAMLVSPSLPLPQPEGGWAWHAFRALGGRASLQRALGGAAGNQAPLQGREGQGDATGSSGQGCPAVSPPGLLRVAGDSGCCKGVVAIFPLLLSRAAMSSPPNALLHSAASRTHYHRLTSAPVWHCIFSLEILSFLSPFTPSVDTVPHVCVWVRPSWHMREGNAFTSPEIADSGTGVWLKRPAPR